MQLGFQIPNISGIPDSLSCILDSRAQDSTCYNSHLPDSGLNKQKFPGFFNNSDSLTSTAPDPDLEIRGGGGGHPDP